MLPFLRSRIPILGTILDARPSPPRQTIAAASAVPGASPSPIADWIGGFIEVIFPGALITIMAVVWVLDGVLGKPAAHHFLVDYGTQAGVLIAATLGFHIARYHSDNWAQVQAATATSPDPSQAAPAAPPPPPAPLPPAPPAPPAPVAPPPVPSTPTTIVPTTIVPIAPVGGPTS